MVPSCIRHFLRPARRWPIIGNLIPTALCVIRKRISVTFSPTPSNLATVWTSRRKFSDLRKPSFSEDCDAKMKNIKLGVFLLLVYFKSQFGDTDYRGKSGQGVFYPPSCRDDALVNLLSHRWGILSLKLDCIRLSDSQQVSHKHKAFHHTVEQNSLFYSQPKYWTKVQ